IQERGTLFAALFKVPKSTTPERKSMTRVLMIVGKRGLTGLVGLKCLEQEMAVRMPDTFCDGLRQMLETPVSLVIVSSSLVHLSSGELAKLFDTIAPGVPVVARLDAGHTDAGHTIDEQARFELP